MNNTQVRIMLAALALGTVSTSFVSAASSARRYGDTLDKWTPWLRSRRTKPKRPPAGTKLARMAAEGRIGIRKGW